jgi:hypothetical protein
MNVHRFGSFHKDTVTRRSARFAKHPRLRKKPFILETPVESDEEARADIETLGAFLETIFWPFCTNLCFMRVARTPPGITRERATRRSQETISTG